MKLPLKWENRKNKVIFIVKKILVCVAKVASELHLRLMQAGLSLCASAKPGKISEAAFNLTQILISILKSFNFNQVNLVVVLLKSKGVI